MSLLLNGYHRSTFYENRAKNNKGRNKLVVGGEGYNGLMNFFKQNPSQLQNRLAEITGVDQNCYKLHFDRGNTPSIENADGNIINYKDEFDFNICFSSKGNNSSSNISLNNNISIKPKFPPKKTGINRVEINYSNDVLNSVIVNGWIKAYQVK